ncbi:MAG: two-component system, NarL family, nitrate/nitrite response regulator NarL [Solirubrobacteraceae bacterium]|jgi:DNA-binding NarL/FixJ family response regulator|nr:two-component system, NarL family, nitrate/nitrite response regulator NarL [Solirubrobacteraceae bacterium]
MNRLLIIGSLAFTADAMRFALQHAPGLSLFGVVENGGDVVGAVREAQPDVIVMDGVTEGTRTLEHLPQIRAEAEDALIVLAVTHLADAEIAHALESHDVVCVWTGAPGPGKGDGLRHLPPVRSLPRPDERTQPATGAPGANLTSRELEALRWVAEGQTNASIARKLWVTEQTVKFHLTNIYRKLGVANRTEASRYALVNGLVPSQSRRDSPALAARDAVSH